MNLDQWLARLEQCRDGYASDLQQWCNDVLDRLVSVPPEGVRAAMREAEEAAKRTVRCYYRELNQVCG